MGKREYDIAFIRMPIYNIMGVVVYSLDRDRNMDIAEIMFHRLGFADGDEYMETFPGKCKPDSECGLFHLSVDKNPKPKDKNGKPMLYGGLLRINRALQRPRTRKVLSTASIWSIEVQNGDIFLLPMKMNEIKKVKNCKSINKRDMWYCEDWKE